MNNCLNHLNFFLSTALKAVFLILIIWGLNTSCQHKDDIVPIEPNRSLLVWLHRVNTIDKARHFQNQYPGFELDVHFDTSVNTFFVRHDFTDTTTLTLATWLGALEKPEQLGYWLDFKNLSQANGPKALAELVRIRNFFHLGQNPIVVESSDPATLPSFDTLNFRISFYIPTFDPETLTPSEEQMYIDYIHAGVISNNIPTISGYHFQHTFMQNNFPDLNKLLWYLDSFDGTLKDSVISLTSKDPAVEILLVAEDFDELTDQ